MDTADLNAVVCWVVFFFFSPFLSFCSGGQKLLSDSVLQEKVSNFLGQVVCRGWGLLLPLSKELYCLSVRGHIHVFFCVSCFLMLLPASLGLRHNLKYINVHNF